MVVQSKRITIQDLEEQRARAQSNADCLQRKIDQRMKNDAHRASLARALYHLHVSNVTPRLSPKAIAAQERISIRQLNRWTHRGVHKGLVLDDVPQRAAIEKILAAIEKHVSVGPNSRLTAIDYEHLMRWVEICGERHQAPTKNDVLAFASRLVTIRKQQDTVVGDNFWRHLLLKYKDTFSFEMCAEKSAARIAAESVPVIREWTDNMAIKVELLNIAEGSILAMDETGFGKKRIQQKRLVKKGGSHYILAERANQYHVSVLHIADNLGRTLPPVTIFEGKRLREGMLSGAPENSVYQYQSNGYFCADHLLSVFRHIVAHHEAGPNVTEFTNVEDAEFWKAADGDKTFAHARKTVTKTFPRLLVLDNALCHVEPAAREFAERHQLHLIFLPPNLTQVMCVCDVGPFALLKKEFYRVELDYRNAHFGQTIPPKEFWYHLGPVWRSTVTRESVLMGFRRAGQWPIDAQPILNSIPSIHSGQVVTSDPQYDIQLRLETQAEHMRAQDLALRDALRANIALQRQLDSIVPASASLSTGSSTSSVQLPELPEMATSIDTSASRTDVSIDVAFSGNWTELMDLHNESTPQRGAVGVAKAKKKRNDEVRAKAVNNDRPRELIDEHTAEEIFSNARKRKLPPNTVTITYGPEAVTDSTLAILDKRIEALGQATEEWRSKRQAKKRKTSKPSALPIETQVSQSIPAAKTNSQRHCKECHATTHDRRTCPTLHTGAAQVSRKHKIARENQEKLDAEPVPNKPSIEMSVALTITPHKATRSTMHGSGGQLLIKIRADSIKSNLIHRRLQF